MRSLFIDTSNADVSIAILENGRLCAEGVKNIVNEHSKYAVSIISDVLKEANMKPSDIEEIFVVNGPGSFTGIRIGLTISKVYAYLNNIKVVLMSSLKCLALSTCCCDYNLVVIDAKRNNYYMCLYDNSYNEIISERCASFDYVSSIIKKYSNIKVISNSNVRFEDTVIKHMDIEKIYNFYKDSERVSANMVLPNYLKLPQVLEKDV